MSDKAWAIISALAGIVAVIITIVIFYYGEIKDTKRLEAILISKANLVNPDVGSAREGLEIRYKGKPIPDLYLFQVRFHNSGRKSITKADFEEPIKVHIVGADEVILPEKLTATPADLAPHVSAKDTTVFIEGALLNSGDQFTVEIAAIPTVGTTPSLQPPSARIVDVKTIEFRPTLEVPRSRFGWYTLFVSIVASLIGALVVMVAYLIVGRVRGTLPYPLTERCMQNLNFWPETKCEGHPQSGTS